MWFYSRREAISTAYRGPRRAGACTRWRSSASSLRTTRVDSICGRAFFCSVTPTCPRLRSPWASAQPILDRLGESLREASLTGSFYGDEIVYDIARSASSRIMSPALNVGRRLPAYCTSIGQVLLAQPGAERTRRLPGAGPAPPLYRAHADHAFAGPAGALQAVHETGYAFASQQMEPRLCTLAVPVRDSAGHYVAGINVILQGRLASSADMAAQFFRPLHDAAMELGSLLLP